MCPFSILMFCFAGALLLYAGLLALTRDYDLIPRGYATRPKDKTAYALAFAKAIAVTALAPLGSGIYGLFSTALGLVMLLINLPLCIWISTHFFRRLP